MNELIHFLQGGILFLVLLVMRNTSKASSAHKLYKYLWLACMLFCVLPIKSLFNPSISITVSSDSLLMVEDSFYLILHRFGIVILSFLFLYRYRELSRRFLRSLPFKNHTFEEEIRYSDEIMTPCTFGLCNPRIYLPKSVLAVEHLEYIIRHEACHIQNKDPIMNLLLLSVCVVNWMHPITWLCLIQIRKEMELICDQEVTKDFSIAQRHTYAKLLIDMLEGKQTQLITFATSDYEERIQAIMKTKKNRNTLLVSVFTCGVFTIICGVLLLNPVEIKGTQASDETETFETVEKTEVFANGKYTLSKEEK